MVMYVLVKFKDVVVVTVTPKMYFLYSSLSWNANKAYTKK